MQTLKLNDYERYLIQLPPSDLFPRRRRKFLFSELEKHHPCFSYDFWFDSAIKVKKWELIADVIVIPKVRFQELSDRHKEKKALVKDCYGKRIIKLKEKSRKLKILFPAIIFVLLMTVFWMFTDSKNETAEIEDQNFIPEEITEDDNDSFILGTFFENIKQNDGKITRLNWQFDGYTEKISAEINSMYPESLSEVGRKQEFSTVVYRNDTVEYSVVIQNRKKSVNRDDDNKVDVSDVRQILLGENAKIIEERLNPSGVIFLCDQNLQVLEKLQKRLEEKGTVVNFASFSVLQNEGVKVELTFNHHLSEGINLTQVYEFENVFTKWKKDKKPEVKVFYSEKKNDEEILVKIGGVTYPSGEKIGFYKNNQGKMIRKKEE